MVYRGDYIAQTSKDNVKKDKAHLELILASDVKHS